MNSQNRGVQQKSRGIWRCVIGGGIVIGLIVVFVCVAGAVYLYASGYKLSNLLPNASPEVKQIVGSDGGEISGPQGIRVVVPNGALEKDTELRIAVSNDNPPSPEGKTGVGATFDVSLPPGTKLMFPLELYLPLERQPDIPDSQYAVYRWDGDHWTLMAGIIEGNAIHIWTDHTTLFRVHNWPAYFYPVIFNNLSGTIVTVRPWSWVTFGARDVFGSALTGVRRPDGVSYGWHRLPPGTYSQWCVEWAEFSTPVWDIYGGGFWTEFEGNYNFVFNNSITLNLGSPTEGDWPNVTAVTFSMQAGNPGLCGEAPGGPAVPNPVDSSRPGGDLEPATGVKPVAFTNHGSKSFSVQAWTYVPLGSNASQTPPDVSMVVTPNSTAYLQLPLGTYTWCYCWEMDDVNKDGVMDYAHAIDSRPVVLDESDSDELDMAEQVDITAPPGSGETPGRCGSVSLLVNPSFEDGLTGWTVRGPGILEVVSGPGASDGQFAASYARYNSPVGTALSQAFSTQPGARYQVRFDARAYAYNESPCTLTVEVIGAAPLFTQTYRLINSVSGPFDAYAFEFIADSSQATLTFTDGGETIDIGAVLDNVIVQRVD